MNLVFFRNVLLSKKFNVFFRKSATIQCACCAEKNTCFFGNAQPKSNAHAHLKQKMIYDWIKLVCISCTYTPNVVPTIYVYHSYYT